MVSRRVQAAYDQIASEYAAITREMPDDLAYFGGRLLTLAGNRGPILDAGCGPGRDLAWLEARGARCVGVDLSAGMLAQARRQARAPLAQMDLRRLALRTGHFAGVWCVASLLHLPRADAAGALAELRRVLRPGGVLFLGIQEGTGETWEQGFPGAGNATVARFFARYQPAEAAALLAHAGFQVREQGRAVQPRRTWLQLLAQAPE
jgi:SAM-dependent methyltransferase